jgi:anaerobic selenocysteine-containing dehydrogenase
VLSTPNGARLDAALGGLEFYVAIDVYRNETTRHANIILPPTWALEHDHYDLALHAFAIRNTAKYSPPCFPKDESARHDWEIFLGLMTRLARKKGAAAGLRAKAIELAMSRVGPDGVLDGLLRTGTNGGLRGLSLRKLKDAPHGIDLGPLTPCLPARLHTRGHRIDLAPSRLIGDLPRLEKHLREASWEGPHLTLIGRRDLRSNNSWMHNSQRLVKGRARCTLMMNPTDARSRGLESGASAKIASRVGEVETTVEVTDDVMPGVVSLPHGWGHGRPGTRQRVASAHAGVSANDLTDELGIDALSGNAILNGVRVTVTSSERS